MTCLGAQTTHWQIRHASLNATKPYQVVFEVRKGNGTSGGGFSLDDINLSETQCPQVTGQINNFVKLLNDAVNGSFGHSQRLYSKGGYSYRFGIILFKTFFALYVQLLSGKFDDQLEWPLPRRQVTFQMIDQHPNLQAQMSKEISITSDLATFNNGTFLMNMRKCEVFTSAYRHIYFLVIHLLCPICFPCTGSRLWDDPRIVGTPFQDEDNQTSYEGPRIGILRFANLEEMKYLSFLKGGSVVVTFNFEGRATTAESMF